MAAACCFGQKKVALTPDLVIDGGYLSIERHDLFPETISGEMDCEVSNDKLHENLTTFMFFSKKAEVVMEKEDKLILFCKDIPVGTDNVSTPVGNFTRSKSEVSFLITIDISGRGYKYEISEMKINRRVDRVDDEYFATARREDMEILAGTGIVPGLMHFGSIDLPTKGEPNTVHWQRVYAMQAERNGYVNLVCREGKTTKGLKSSWVDKVKRQDDRIASEMRVYDQEYQAVLDFAESLNSKLTGEIP